MFKRLVMFVVVAALGMVSTVTVLGTAGERANGDAVGHGADGAYRSFDFTAHGEVPMANGTVREAKGHATLTNLDNGLWWSMAVAAAKVDGQSACFIGPITDGDAVALGRWMRVVVLDHGPGAADEVYTRQATEAEARSWFETCSASGLLLQLIAEDGNLTVH